MTIAPSKSIQRVKDGYIYGWSGSQSLTSGATTLLDYNNPSDFYLTRLMLVLDFQPMAAGEVLSYTINVDGQSMITFKEVLSTATLGIQPLPLEVVLAPNSRVIIACTQSNNAGSGAAILTGFKI